MGIMVYSLLKGDAGFISSAVVTHFQKGEDKTYLAVHGWSLQKTRTGLVIEGKS